MKDKNTILRGHLACFIAYFIFGINIITCKDLTNGHYMSPIALFCFRSIGAGVIFWIISFFMPFEKVEKQDLLKIFAASTLGFFLTQISFLMGISEITPMDCSIVGALSPIYTMFIAAIALKEPITWKKAGGVALSFVGIIYLILNSVSSVGGATETRPIGVLLIIVNSICFSLYLGLFRPLINKYSVITFMKWIFLFSSILAIPLSIKEILNTDYTALPSSFFSELAFLVIFATFVSYLLIPIGQKYLRPTLVSMYTYTQPIVAIVISISMGMDNLTWQKVIAAITVFTGVVLVNYSRARNQT